MAPKKKVVGLIKLQITAGQANPAPPVGPALGQHGVNIMEFCKAYNAATENQRGDVIPVEITVYEELSPRGRASFGPLHQPQPNIRLDYRRSKNSKAYRATAEKVDHTSLYTP